MIDCDPHEDAGSAIPDSITPAAHRTLWRVQLRHRASGALLRLGGLPLTLLGKDRPAVEATALADRDRAVWKAVATAIPAIGV